VARRPLVPVRRAVAVGLAAGLASRAVLAASIGWLVVLGAVYASDAGPALPAMAVTAAALYPIAAWAGAAQLAGTSRELRAVLTAACGWPRTLLADAVPPLLWLAGASLFGVLANVVFDPHPASLPQVLLGAALHLLCGAAGVALALAAHARNLSRGATPVVILAATLASLLVDRVPPAGPILRAWADPGRPPSVLAGTWAILGPLALTAALALATGTARRHRL
jgi:hypothetical protein